MISSTNGMKSGMTRSTKNTAARRATSPGKRRSDDRARRPKPAETFETGIRKTVAWYLENLPWVEDVASGDYRRWIEANYGERGTGA